MAAPRETKLYAVSDAKLGKLTDDPSGGSPTYATLVDVPGIKEVGISGDVTAVDLRGDNTLLDTNSTLSSITLTVAHAKISLDALVVLLGGAVTDTGATTAEVATYLLTRTTALNSYFKFEAKTPTNGGDTIGGDVHFLLHKCVLTSFPDMGLAEEDYRTVSFEARCLPLTSNGNWLSIVNNETAAAIA